MIRANRIQGNRSDFRGDYEDIQSIIFTFYRIVSFYYIGLRGAIDWIITNNIFNVIKSFGFDVVLKPGLYPRRNVIAPVSNGAITDAGSNCKFFLIQSSFFEKLFESFFSHIVPLKYGFNAHYSKKCTKSIRIKIDNNVLVYYNIF
ncbi:hypothetical protein SAMN05660197_0750 [Nitratiruptor tergarcus DSM 16512]|uniref:Uncharacterized protein n=1 Tax=Nitratiruptor tergarcus DSM 16512 TaxID=1069081 RepID=A0A1W1WRW5_9BACT|nr:hypothetical protein SAMN05660197_0750 [Nitratiruptor tergarcus DSM 16512]